MHQTRLDGSLIASFCDFCKKQWDPEGTDIMIEGHQGSLMCTSCLSIAYRSLVLMKLGEENVNKKCTMCLEERKQPEWESPVEPDVRACLRCVRQAATALEKDPDSGWQRPGPTPTSAVELGDED